MSNFDNKNCFNEKRSVTFNFPKVEKVSNEENLNIKEEKVCTKFYENNEKLPSDMSEISVLKHSNGTYEAQEEVIVNKQRIIGPIIPNTSDGACEDRENVIIRRQSISITDKEKLINAFEDGEDIYHFGKLLGIKATTVRSIVSRYNRTSLISTGKRGGYRKPIIGEEIASSLLHFLDENYAATLIEMKQYLQEIHSIAPSISTISKFLKTQYISHKKLRFTDAEKNSDRIKSLRQEYVENHLRSVYRSIQCIYIDESSFNVWMQRKTSGPINSLGIYNKPCTQHGPNISLVLAFSVNGLIHHKVIIGSFKNNSYQNFINELSFKLPSTIHYLIHDNSLIHNSTITTTENNKIVQLPPYSSFLNPIKTVFCQIKSKIRTKLASTIDISSMTSADKCQLMNDLVIEQFSTGDYKDLSHHYDQIMTFYPDCLYKNDIV